MRFGNWFASSEKQMFMLSTCSIILATGRSSFHLETLEAVLFRALKPILCRQKEFYALKIAHFRRMPSMRLIKQSVTFLSVQSHKSAVSDAHKSYK